MKSPKEGTGCDGSDQRVAAAAVGVAEFVLILPGWVCIRIICRPRADGNPGVGPAAHLIEVSEAEFGQLLGGSSAENAGNSPLAGSQIGKLRGPCRVP